MLRIGSRVKILKGAPGDLPSPVLATVALTTGTCNSLIPDQLLLCLDRPSKAANARPDLVGFNFGWYSSTKIVTVLPGDYSSLPDHVVLLAKQTFDHDGVRFHRCTAFGKPLRFSATGDRVTVSWNFTYHGFRTEENPSAGRIHHNCWTVPYEYLSWGIVKNEEVTCAWPQDHPPQKGSLVAGEYAYLTGEGARVEYVGLHGPEVYQLSMGAILQIVEVKGNHAHVVVAGGAPQEIIGLRTMVMEPYLAPIDMETFFEKGGRVEIVAPVEFKGRNLQGLAGTVILPTDPDGDVGIQFDAPVDGGSLDGMGRNKHCLYVPGKVLKKAAG